MGFLLTSARKECVKKRKEEMKEGKRKGNVGKLKKKGGGRRSWGERERGTEGGGRNIFCYFYSVYTFYVTMEREQVEML